jgi:DNA repair exonuclease SbcCD nuclease subunit
VLVGNHDFTNLDCLDHSLKTLAELPNVKVVDTVLTDDSGKLGFIPYSNTELLKLRLTEAKSYGADVIFCHADVIGLDYGNGYISEKGIVTKDLKPFKLVVSGHYHKYQEKGNLVYLGTPFAHSFGEANQDKFIAVFDSETYELELFDTPFPKYCKLIVNCSEDGIVNLNLDNVNRVILTGSEEDVANYERIPGVSYIEEPDKAEAENVLDESDSHAVQFIKWAEDIKDLDPDTISLGLEILEDV